jgi:nifR3 family TIM-barrel protein
MHKDLSFHIGNVPIYGDAILAPMAGFADVPHRQLASAFGSAMNYTEFVAVEDVINRSKLATQLLDFADDERPKVIQLFGNDAGKFLQAALMVQALGPDIIDINMGCSTRRVSGRGAGVGMMPQLDLVQETFDLLHQNLSVPVTGKIRLGWEESRNFIEVATTMEACGAAMIAIHPRTKEQGYKGEADWGAVAELKDAVSVPIIGSGDVTTPDQMAALKNQTGCDAIMIGRGAIGNPWIFQGIDKRYVTNSEIRTTMTRHLMMMLDYHGPRGLILFRKYMKKYLGGVEGIDGIPEKMLVTDDVDEFLMLLDSILPGSLKKSK